MRSLNRFISNKRVMRVMLPRFIEIPSFDANNVDSRQRLHSVASDLGLYCLDIPLLEDARHKWLSPGLAEPGYALPLQTV